MLGYQEHNFKDFHDFWIPQKKKKYFIGNTVTKTKIQPKITDSLKMYL